MEVDEISYAINDALIRYNRCSISDIFTRLEWLWRAVAYLRAGLKARMYAETCKKSEKERFENALNTINREILPQLKTFYNDPYLAKITILAHKNPQAAIKYLQYIVRLNELRDDVVEISTYTDFLVIEPLILGEKTIKRKIGVLKKLNKAVEE